MAHCARKVRAAGYWRASGAGSDRTGRSFGDRMPSIPADMMPPALRRTRRTGRRRYCGSSSRRLMRIGELVRVSTAVSTASGMKKPGIVLSNAGKASRMATTA